MGWCPRLLAPLRCGIDRGNVPHSGASRSSASGKLGHGILDRTRRTGTVRAPAAAVVPEFPTSWAMSCTTLSESCMMIIHPVASLSRGQNDRAQK